MTDVRSPGPCGVSLKKDRSLTVFSDLGLAPALLSALATEGYTTPTPIQAKAIPFILEGRDVLGIAQTGTGKTAAFALPILHRLADQPRRPAKRGCRVLVLSPTRELATQIAEGFRTYGRNLGVRCAVIFGGVGYAPQYKAMADGVDVLVATPGRLLDLIDSGNVLLATTEVLVLDEADQMLDLGFLVPIRRVVAKLPAQRQNLFFSATMPAAIGKLASELLKNPAQVSVAPVATTVEKVDQSVIFVEASRKRSILTELFADPTLTRTLVFTRTKHGADKVARHLELEGIAAAAIHGNKSQAQRERALAMFKAGRIRALVATDIAARGIDVDAVSHVVNFELPNVAESYVHRIGRTARAGAAGIAISLCDGEERAYLRDIERLTRQSIKSTDRRGEPGRDAPIESEPRAARQEAGRRDGHRPDARRSQPSGAPDRRFAKPAEARPRPVPAGGESQDGMAQMPWMRNAGPAGARRDAGTPPARDYSRASAGKRRFAR
jgi:ATP-dependent RNA helicase RhlE